MGTGIDDLRAQAAMDLRQPQAFGQQVQGRDLLAVGRRRSGTFAGRPPAARTSLRTAATCSSVGTGLFHRW